MGARKRAPAILGAAHVRDCDGARLPRERSRWRLGKKAGDFLNLLFTPEHAVKVTLQPIPRCGFDAAILFSGIQVVFKAALAICRSM